MYYICGWLVHACAVESKRRGGKTLPAKLLQKIFDNCSVLETEKKNLPSVLPIRKVERAMKYGGLRFVTADFFQFVCIIESIFEEFLSVKSMIIHGMSIIRLITNILLSNDHVFSKFKLLLPDEND